MIKIIGFINLLISAILWFICIKGWKGSKEGYILAYFLKYPAILFTSIGVILFIIAAFIK